MRYSIRKSFYDEALSRYRYREIYDLGENPSDHIHRIADHVFYFDEDLEEAVSRESQGDATIILEDILEDFLTLDERTKLKNFRRSSYPKLSALTSEEIEEINKNVHIFDRRRLFYIRYGAVDQSRIYRVSDKLYRPLLFKCRDEKEYYLKNLERSLRPVEFKKYIYVIFNLQEYFSESYSPFMPEALDQVTIDEAFVLMLCKLNEDNTFWQDEMHCNFLRAHLRHYVVRYFDSDFQSRSFAYDNYRSFRSQHRNFKWPERSKRVSEEETSEIFGEKIETLKSFKRADLVRLFREKAKQHHPDSGGDPDKFIRLLAAYEELKTRFFS